MGETSTGVPARRPLAIAAMTAIIAGLFGAGSALGVAQITKDAEMRSLTMQLEEQREAEARVRREDAYLDFLTTASSAFDATSAFSRCLAGEDVSAPEAARSRGRACSAEHERSVAAESELQDVFTMILVYGTDAAVETGRMLLREFSVEVYALESIALGEALESDMRYLEDVDFVSTVGKISAFREITCRDISPVPRQQECGNWADSTASDVDED